MVLTLEKIRAAGERISGYAVKTPLLRLSAMDSFLGCRVYVKAECMQVTGSFKFRGAVNKALSLTPEQLGRGIVAVSSGNHARGISYAAKLLGAKVTVVMPLTATAIKVSNTKALGAEVIQCENQERFKVAERICAERGAVMVHPFNDEDIMAGQGTAGLEIAEQCPELDRLIIPISGGGLFSGVSTAVKALAPKVKVYAAEPSALPRYTVSVKAGTPTAVPPKKTVADALVSLIPGDKCFPCVAANADGIAAVDDEFILKGMKLLLAEGKVLCEPSSAIGIGAVLQGLIKVNPEDNVCFLISGGNVALDQLSILDDVVI